MARLDSLFFPTRPENEIWGVIGTWQFNQLSFELAQLLYIGQWLHCGKNATFGLGKYQITNL